MKPPKSPKSSFVIAAIAGFLAGCAVVYFVRSRGMDAGAAQSQPATNIHGAQNPESLKNPVPGEARSLAISNDKIPKQAAEARLRGAGARRVLNEIKRDKLAPASVNVRFFSTINGKLSQQFIDFFELSPVEAGGLSDLIQATRTELWRSANSQAEISQTETGGIVAKIPPVEAGADIYDKVMDGFHAVLGDERYHDMMLYNGGQFERLFNQFGGEASIVLIVA